VISDRILRIRADPCVTLFIIHTRKKLVETMLSQIGIRRRTTLCMRDRVRQRKRLGRNISRRSYL
jgi:hypothetical protein